MIIKILSIYLFVGVMLLSSMFINSYRKGKSTYAKTFGALCLSLQIYLLGYLLEINTESLENMILWNQIQYFGIPFFPTLWLLVSMQYTGRVEKMKTIKGILLFFIPIMTFLLRFTNEWHHLYYKRIEVQEIAGVQVLYLTKGPWYFIQMAYVLFTLIICTWFYFQRYRKSVGDERVQFRLLLIASILPYLALILVSTNFGGIGIDYTAIILPPCIFMIHLALSYFNFLEIQLLARERVFEDSASGLLLMNRFYKLVDHNEKSLTILSNVHSDLNTETLKDLLTDEQEFLQIVKKQEQTIWILKKEEKEIYIDTKIQKIMNKTEIVGFLVTLTDVTEFEILKKQLMEIASTDELSGLNNRRKFRELAKAACERAERYQEEASILMLDIDFFKKVNDSYGHQTGDEVIREFSRLLSKVFRGTDLVGRMGGEEFAVYMLHTNMEAAFEKAEIFRKLIEATPMSYGTESFHITVSIGVAEFSKKLSTLDSLLNSADEALYQAKKNGRNRTEHTLIK